jgi:aminopeptidase N
MARRAGDRPGRQFWAQGQTNENHHWFPCFDAPNDKATSEVAMTIADDLTGISNGALVETRANGDGTKTLRWRQSRPHSVYLVTVAAGRFVELKDTWRGRPVSYIVPEDRAAAAKAVFSKTPKMMEFFSRQIGFDYPWEKYAQTTVAAFPFAGMENTSATTLTDTILATAGDPEDAESLIAHELAHQWWGNLVTCRDWSHAWLNEGFATYFELLWTEHERGRAAFDRGLRDAADEYFASDATRRRPLVYNVYREPFDLFFDGTIYPKGAWVVHMLRRHLGDALFWKGIKRYVEKHQYGLATSDDLRIALEEASNQKLDWFFDQWVYRSGHPEFQVTMAWDASAKALAVTVRQVQPISAKTPAFQAPADIEITTASGKVVKKVWIDRKEAVFTFPLDGPPKSVVFDPNDAILKKLVTSPTVDELISPKSE